MASLSSVRTNLAASAAVRMLGMVRFYRNRRSPERWHPQEIGLTAWEGRARWNSLSDSFAVIG